MWIYSCNTTLYHPPIATIAIIVINVIAFFATMSSPVLVEQWSLWHGNGLHPLQWVSSIFLHADGSHLFGNMVFLWPLGLLVEGKVGWLRMLVLYLAIGVAQSAVEQVIMLGVDSESDAVESVLSELYDDPEFAALSPEEQDEMLAAFREFVAESGTPGSLGASSAIFGILAVCILFAPVSDFEAFYFWMGMGGTFEIPVLVVGGMYILLDVVYWFMGSMSIGTSALHLMGAFFGVIGGVAYLRAGWAATDGEDFFAHFFDQSLHRKRKPKVVAEERQTTRRASDQTAVPLMGPLTEQTRVEQARVVVADESFDPWDTSDTAGSFGSPTVLEALATKDLVEAAIRAEQYGEASKLIIEEQSHDVLAGIPLAHYQRLVKHAADMKQWGVAAWVLQKSLLVHHQDINNRRLQLAQILARPLKKPSQAISLVQAIDEVELNASQRKVLLELRQRLKLDA